MYNILLTLILNFFLKLQIDIWYFFACRKVFAMNHKLQNSVFIRKKISIHLAICWWMADVITFRFHYCCSILCNIEFLRKKIKIWQIDAKPNPHLIQYRWELENCISIFTLSNLRHFLSMPAHYVTSPDDGWSKTKGGYVGGFTTYLACFDPAGIVSCLSQCLKIERVVLQYKMLACRKISKSSWKCLRE